MFISQYLLIHALVINLNLFLINNEYVYGGTRNNIKTHKIFIL